MIGRTLVQPLEDDWRDTLDAVARARRWPTSQEPARLAAEVAKLSAEYNARGRPSGAALAARLGFWFARDVPKGAAAARELVATGAVRLRPDVPLRVLDLGAGLGAMTHGLARALAGAGGRGTIDAVWVDADGAALELGKALLAARSRGDADVSIHARTSVGDVATWTPRGGRFDVILVGQVLSELDADVEATPRADKHAALIRRWITDALAPDGALIVIEPALRDRTRHLHRVRDALVRSGGVSLFSPCLHSAPCPALAREGDWCHEDLDVALPEWLVPVARAAGLRYEGLTFSYVALRAAPGTLAERIAPGRSGRLRVVSGPLVSKGKHELFVCGELGSSQGPVVGRARAMRLDRDARPTNRAWDACGRGDLLLATPPPDVAKPRVDASTHIEVLDEVQGDPVAS